MAKNNSKLYNFFFADGYRTTVIIIIILGIIFFGIVLYLTFSKKRTNFKLLFIVMLNVMISALLSIIGYLFNWKIEKENVKTLLFDNKFPCIMQSTFLAFFQSSRESFLTLLTFLVLLNYLNQKIKLDEDNTLYKVLIFCFCYGIPFIANIIYISIDAFGESHLFCFVKLDKPGPLCGTIHFSYLLFLLILNVIFTLYIIINDSCKKEEVNDVWFEDEYKKSCLNPLLKKIIFYPIAQIISLSFPINYRFSTFVSENGNEDKIAGIASVLNSVSSFIYTFIFMLSNNLLINFKDDKENNAVGQNVELNEGITLNPE